MNVRSVEHCIFYKQTMKKNANFFKQGQTIVTVNCTEQNIHIINVQKNNHPINFRVI